jgi:hypothetical protein
MFLRIEEIANADTDETKSLLRSEGESGAGFGREGQLGPKEQLQSNPEAMGPADEITSHL